MAYHRHPKTQNERRQDARLQADARDLGVPVKGRLRSGSGRDALPTERSDLVPASAADKFRKKKQR